MASYFSGAISGVNAAFQGNTVGTFVNYGGGDPMSEKLEACIAALGQTDPEDDRNTIITYNPKLTEGTCEWVLEDKVFQRWSSDEGSAQPLIWACGRGGMGKTTLAVYISEHLEHTGPTETDTWVLYYFCDRRYQNRNTAASILKGFIYQLYKKQHDLASTYYEAYRTQGEPLLHPHSIEALWRIFRGMVNASPVKRMFCIIDGVDQCQEDNLEHFLKKLNDYATRHNQRHAPNAAESMSHDTPAAPRLAAEQPGKVSDMRIIVLSRQNPTCVVNELSPFPRLVLRETADLKRYTDAAIDKVSASYSGSKEPSKETTEVVKKALASGQDQDFLWVSLVTEKLMSMTQNQMSKYVTKMPTTVDEMHMRTLLEVPSRQRLQVSTILKWVSLAERPLSTLELTKAVKYSLKTSFSKRGLRKALRICPGLVQRQGKQVVLADESIRTLLFGKHSPFRQEKKLQEYVLDYSDGHSEMANTCIAYLQESANLEKSRRVRLKPGDKLKAVDAAFLRKHPFLEYAIVHWPSHAKKGNAEKTDYAAPFFKENSARRKLWWESYWISLREWFAWKWTAPGRFSLLHLAAYFDIVPLALYVEQQGRINQLLGSQDDQGMKPINRATERSQTAMVDFLLQRGEFDDEALRQASRTGQASIVAMLLENRAKALHSPRFASAKSSPATSPGAFHSFKQLTLSTISDFSKKLDSPHDSVASPLSPDVKGYGKATTETPLHIAATCGHDKVVEALLNSGEDIHKVTDGGWTALHNAAWFGRVPVVECLITAGADAKANTKEQLTPLHCAVKNSQPSIVEALLKTRAVDIEAEDQFGLTPFHMACKSNNIPIMEILLDYGASIERRMRQGWTPLLWACTNGRIAVAHLLLKRGANIRAKWTQVHQGVGKVMELGPVGLAKAYGHQEMAALMERVIMEKFGVTGAERLSVGDVEDLPPAEPSEERYDVPEVADFIAVEPEDSDAGALLEADDTDDSVASRAESDDESDVSDGGSRSRKQSTSGIQGDGKTRRKSSHALAGLGIQEETSGDVELGAVQDAEAKSTAVDADHPKTDVTGVSQDLVQPDVPGQPYNEPEPKAADTASTAPYATEIGNTVPERGAGDTASERRSSSTAMSPAWLGDRLGRFVPRKPIASRQGSSTEEEKPAGVAGGVDVPIHDTVDTKVSDAGSPDVGILGRFGGPKRVFSWKKDAGSNDKVATSPGILSATDPLDVAGRTPSGASESGLPTADELPRAVQEESSPDVASSPGLDAISKFGRFGAKRVLSWKSASKGKGGAPASPLDSLGPVAEGSDQNC